jgi:Domain of Unknown Function (DUF1543)
MNVIMTIIGCKPVGRQTEQHDVYIGIAENIKELVPQLKIFWPEAATKMHLDAFKVITQVDGFDITVVAKSENIKNDQQLYFINLGGYKENEMEEFHYKMLVVANNKAEAIAKSKQTAFYKHTGFKGATSHIDDKYGIDVDDIYTIEDMLSADLKDKFKIVITPATIQVEDKLHLGYFKLTKIENGIFTPE